MASGPRVVRGGLIKLCGFSAARYNQPDREYRSISFVLEVLQSGPATRPLACSAVSSAEANAYVFGAFHATIPAAIQV